MSEITPRRWPLVVDGSLDGDFVSNPLNVSNTDNLGIQLSWSGAPTGTFAVQDSNDAEGMLVIWDELTLSSVPTAAGSADSWSINLNQFPFDWMRLVYTSTLVETFTVVTVADVAGSLNNKYFFFSEVGGDDYYCWFNVNSAGTDPAIVGRTGIEVALATGDANTVVAAAIETAVELETDISVVVAGHTCTCTQPDPGHATAASAQNSGFTVTNAQAGSLLQAVVTGKGI